MNQFSLCSKNPGNKLFLITGIIFIFMFSPIYSYTQKKSTTIYPKGLIPTNSDEYKNNLKNVINLKSNEILPPVTDWSKSPHFPPVGMQHNGSCTPWSLVYYTLTFYRAKALNIDFTGNEWELNAQTNRYEPPISIQKDLLNPYFAYNLNNGGVNNGSSLGVVSDMLRSVGVPSWDEASACYDDVTYWPEEEKVWENASKNRIEDWFFMRKDEGYNLNYLKELISDGIFITFGIKIPDNMDVITTNDLPNNETLFEYNLWSDHAVTIVGYNDTITYNENGSETHGAFKVVNSWGKNWGPYNNGMFYISYNALLEKIWQLFVIKKTTFAEPSVFSSISFSHDYKYNVEFRIYPEFLNYSKNIWVQKFAPVSNNLTQQFQFDGTIALDLSQHDNILSDNPSNVFVYVRNRDQKLNCTVNSVHIKFDNEFFNLVHNQFYSEQVNTAIPANGEHYFKVTPLNIKEDKIKDELNYGDTLLIDFDTPWENHPLQVDISLDNINWQKISSDSFNNEKYIVLKDDISSPDVKLKLYYTENPKVRYEVKKNLKIGSPNAIQIIKDIENKEIVLNQDKPEIAWSTIDKRPVNLLLRSDSSIIDTLALNYNAETFIFDVKHITSFSDSCFIQISDQSNKHFAFSKKFKLTSPIQFTQTNLKSQYLINDTVFASFDVQDSKYYPIHVDICNEEGCKEIGSVQEGNHIEWIIPDTIGFSESNQLRIRTGYDSISVLHNKYFSTVPGKIVFRKTILRGEEEDHEQYGAVPLIHDTVILVSSGYLTAITTTGKIIWSKSVPNCTSYSSVVSDRDQFYTTVNQTDPAGNKLHTYNPDGNKIWSSNVVSEVFVFNNGNVNIQSNGNLVAYSPTTLEIAALSPAGEVVWKFDPLEINSEIHAGGGFFLTHSCLDVHDNYYFTTKGKINKLTKSGTFLFSKDLYNNSSFDGTILIGLDQNPIVVQQTGIDKYDSDGTHIWHSDVKTFFQPVITHDGNIIIVSNESNGHYGPPKITCMDPYGKTKWIFNLTQGTFISGPVIGESENIYVLTSNQSLLAVSPTGEKLQEILLDDPVVIPSASPNSLRRGGISIDKNGNIIIATKEGDIWSVSLNEKRLGKTAWPKALNDLSNKNRQQNLLSLEIDSLNSNTNIGGVIKLKVEKSDTIENVAFAYRRYNIDSDWTSIQLTSNDSDIYSWNFNDNIHGTAEVEIKVYDVENPGYCDFLETLITVHGCTEDTLTKDISICKGETFNEWNTSGVYTQTYENISGCDSVVVTSLTVHELPNSDFVANTDTLVATNTHASYQWHDQDGAIEGATSNQYILQKDGTYYLEVFNEIGCSSISEGMNIVKTRTKESLKSPLCLIALPNPNNGKFIVRFETGEAGEYQFRTVNELGQVKFIKNITVNGIYQEEFDFSHFTKGIYFITISNGELVKTQKMIIH